LRAPTLGAFNGAYTPNPPPRGSSRHQRWRIVHRPLNTMEKGKYTKTPVHTGTNAPKIGEDGLSNRARKRKNKENGSDSIKPKNSFKHGQRDGSPRIPGNKSFDRKLAGKKIDTSNSIHWRGVLVDEYGWRRPCPVVDEMRKTALDLIKGTKEQDRSSFLLFHPVMDTKTWETPISSLLNQPLRQVWPIVGFKPVTPTILGFVPPFKPLGFRKMSPEQRAKVTAYKQFINS